MLFARALLLAAAASVTSVAAVPAQIPADTAALIDRVFSAVNRTDAPGCVLGVDRGGRPLYRRGYGMASLEMATPMSEFSVVESGSVAKQFTAAAIAHLAGQGKLSLDDPIRKYIPELADYGAPVTIRMALNHTSGIRDMWTLFVLAGQTPGSVLYSMDQALRMVYRQRELNFPPNSQFLYSNSGFLLLAEVVQRVSGMPLSRYSQEYFFQPLGMTSTQWRDDWNRVVPGRVTAYTTASNGYRVEMPFMSVYGAGGLLTTVGDLLKWNQNLEDPQVGGRDWAAQMHQRGRLTSGREIEYALGLFVTSYRGEREVSHGGATGGYRTFLARWPDRKLSIAVLCNAANAGPENLAHRVVDVFLGARPAAAAANTTAPATGDVTAYLGRFRAPATEELLTVASRDGRLFAEFGGRAELQPAGPDRFRATAAPVEVAFRRGGDGKVAGLALVLSESDTTLYDRLEVPATTAAELAPLTGTYFSPELDVRYTLAAKDTTLTVANDDQPARDLVRTGPDSFAQPGGLALRMTRARNGRPDGFLLFAGRVKNLRFGKVMTR